MRVKLLWKAVAVEIQAVFREVFVSDAFRKARKMKAKSTFFVPKNTREPHAKPIVC